MREIRPKKYRKGRKRAAIKRYVKRAMLMANIIFALALLVSYLANFVNPRCCYFVAFIGLLYPIWLIINILMAIFWLFTIRRRAFISIFAIAVGFQYLGNVFTINSEKKIDNEQTIIDILSYNVRVFNRWNWVKNENQGSEIVKFLKRSKAQIICLQEFYSDHEKHNNVEAIQHNSRFKNSYISYLTKNGVTYKSGISIFSSYPIIRKGKVGYKEADNFCIYADLQIYTKIIRVYNVHLKSIRLGYADYKFLKNINHTDTIDVKGAHHILQKMKNSYMTRAEQADLIAKHIKNCNYPVILCGDFNDVPMSYTYHTIANSLTDAFRKSGNGVGATYTGTYMPFRIDFILYSKGLKAVDYKTGNISLSDHYPVSSTLQFKN